MCGICRACGERERVEEGGSGVVMNDGCGGRGCEKVVASAGGGVRASTGLGGLRAACHHFDTKPVKRMLSTREENGEQASRIFGAESEVTYGLLCI